MGKSRLDHPGGSNTITSVLTRWSGRVGARKDVKIEAGIRKGDESATLPTVLTDQGPASPVMLLASRS